MVNPVRSYAEPNHFGRDHEAVHASETDGDWVLWTTLKSASDALPSEPGRPRPRVGSSQLGAGTPRLAGRAVLIEMYFEAAVQVTFISNRDVRPFLKAHHVAPVGTGHLAVSPRPSQRFSSRRTFSP